MSIVVKDLGKKWEQVYNDEDETIIWRYDTLKNKLCFEVFFSLQRAYSYPFFWFIKYL